MKYSRVIVETQSGRLISIIKDEYVEPGDVDYSVLYNDIPVVVETINGRIVTVGIVEELLDMGIMRRV